MRKILIISDDNLIHDILSYNSLHLGSDIEIELSNTRKYRYNLVILDKQEQELPSDIVVSKLLNESGKLSITTLLDLIKYELADRHIISDLILFPKRRLIYSHDKYEKLTEIEANILQTLLSNSAGCTKQEIQKHVLGYCEEALSFSVENHISKIRAKLAILSPDYKIETSNGVYRINIA